MSTVEHDTGRYYRAIDMDEALVEEAEDRLINMSEAQFRRAVADALGDDVAENVLRLEPGDAGWYALRDRLVEQIRIEWRNAA